MILRNYDRVGRGIGEVADFEDEWGTVFEEALSGGFEVVGVNGEEEAAGGLGIGEEDLNFLGDVGAEVGEFVCKGEVFPSSTGDASL